MTDRSRPDAALRGVVPLPTRNMVRDPSVARAIAARSPSSATWDSEVNKDRTGKHGSEVA